MATNRVKVTLHGNPDGQRSVEVIQRGGFSTRHVKVPREDVPSIFEPTPETIPEPTPEPNTPDTVADVLMRMERRWLYLDEIVFVARCKLRLDETHRSIAPALEVLIADGRVEMKTENGRDLYRLTPSRKSPDTVTVWGASADPETRGEALKSLLMEVDAMLAGGVNDA